MRAGPGLLRHVTQRRTRAAIRGTASIYEAEHLAAARSSEPRVKPARIPANERPKPKFKCTITVTHIACLDVGGLSAQFSGTVKTAHGDAIPRSAYVPSGISDTPVSAASVPETRTALSSGRHCPDSRLTRLTAGPIAVKSSRSAAPIL